VFYKITAQRTGIWRRNMEKQNYFSSFVSKAHPKTKGNSDLKY
jgi:hypothetical protein